MDIKLSAAIALALLAAFLGWRLDAARTTIAEQDVIIEQARVDIDRADQANQSNLDTITAQTAALNDCLANAAADQAAAARERVAREQLERERATLRLALADERKRDYETDPDYRTWADTRVPDSSARRVRDAAARADGNPDGGSHP